MTRNLFEERSTGGRRKRTRKGQAVLEYSLVAGITIAALFAMTPMIKRGVQGMIKSVADQVGNQEQADQDFEPGKGYLERQYATTRVSTDKETIDLLGDTTYLVDDMTHIKMNAAIDLGFTGDN